MRYIWLIIGVACFLIGCGTPVASRATPVLQVNITPAPTDDISATKTALTDAIVPTRQPEGLYVVRDGDTLESIAFAFNTTVEEITTTNKISDANVIQVGQALIIPSLLDAQTPLTTTDVLTDTLTPDQNQSKDVTPTP